MRMRRCSSSGSSARDSVSLEQARAILAAQASRESRLTSGRRCAREFGDRAQLRQAVDRLHERYLRLAAHASVKFQHSSAI